MQTPVHILSELDAWLPNAKVVEDVRQIVEAESSGQLEFDSGAVVVPAGTSSEIISKALIKQKPGFGFGSCFRVVVAIGEATSKSGVLQAQYAFATVWYSISGELITTDFTRETPV